MAISLLHYVVEGSTKAQTEGLGSSYMMQVVQNLNFKNDVANLAEKALR